MANDCDSLEADYGTVSVRTPPYNGTSSRAWVSLGGGKITIVKMGVPPPATVDRLERSFTASGVYRHAKK